MNFRGLINSPLTCSRLHRPPSADAQEDKSREVPAQKTRTALKNAKTSNKPAQTPTDLARALTALRLNTEEILKHKHELEQLNGWFEIALDNMARGLSMFDADQRLIVCNKMYREIYQLPEELTRPGTPLADIVRFHVERETGSRAP